MSSVGDTENPFLALLQPGPGQGDGVSKQLIEKILLFTLSKDAPSQARNVEVLCLADVVVADNSAGDTLSEDLLAHALFERLMLTETSKYLQPRTSENQCTNVEQALETKAIIYLHGAFTRCEQIHRDGSTKENQDCDKIVELILNNASTCMRQPDLFAPQSFGVQWLELFEKSDEHDISTQEFLVRVVAKVLDDVEPLEALGAFKAIFYPMLGDLQKQLARENLINIKKNIFWILGFFSREKRTGILGELLIDYTTPNPKAKGQLIHRNQSKKLKFIYCFQVVNIWTHSLDNCCASPLCQRSKRRRMSSFVTFRWSPRNRIHHCGNCWPIMCRTCF